MKLGLNEHKTHLIFKSENTWGRNYFRFFVISIFITSAVELVIHTLNSFDTYNYFEVLFMIVLGLLIYLLEFKMSYKKDISLHEIDAVFVNKFLGDKLYFVKLKNGKYRRIPTFENYQEEERSFQMMDELGFKIEKANCLLFST